jgi:hypothetical protein
MDYVDVSEDSFGTSTTDTSKVSGSSNAVDLTNIGSPSSTMPVVSISNPLVIRGVRSGHCQLGISDESMLILCRA